MAEPRRHEGRGGEERQELRARTSTWEWVAAVVSAVLVFGAIGLMLHEALTQPRTPPSIEIVQEEVLDLAGGGHVVRFRAHNRGTTTAAGLVVEGELRGDTGTVEKAQVTIDYVPADASRAAGLFFAHDPRRFALEIRPKGYDVP